MKLSGITEKGFKRLSTALRAQETDVDYGEGALPEYVQEAFDVAGAYWTEDGWVVPGDLDLSSLGFGTLPLMSFVGGDFNCSNNQLSFLDGAPREVGGDFNCSYNGIALLDDGPDKVGGDYYCHDNLSEFYEDDVRAVCEVGGIVYS
jgi:hypothetical protein